MERLCVRDLHGPFDGRTLASLPAGARIQWREPLAGADLARAVGWLHLNPEASLRLYGRACDQLGALARGPFVPARLALDATRLDTGLSLPGVGDLTLAGTPTDWAAALAAFPALETLQADLRGGAFDLATLAHAPKLRRLSLANARLRGEWQVESPPGLKVIELRDMPAVRVEELLRLPGTVALRLSRIGEMRSIDALTGHANLRVVALEALTHVDCVHVLATLPRLESLDVRGLWQLSLDDVAFIPTMLGLRRLGIDIGGRRKNVEIYKKVRLPKPPPFDVRYDLTTS
jgi:hypothetical protein